MRIIQNHFYGSQDRIDLQLVKLKLELDDSRECDALENGWALYRDIWYCSRLTRINVELYKKYGSVKGYSFLYQKKLTDEQKKRVLEVYDTYLKYKNFNRLYDLEIENPRTSWILCISDIIHAFTILTEYDGALESNISAWDYIDPKKGIGRALLDYEVEEALVRNYKYLYIGPGYGTSSIYKSKLKGFEWWTGSEWSTDTTKYVDLCNRDETINTLENLGKLYVSS